MLVGFCNPFPTNAIASNGTLSPAEHRFLLSKLLCQNYQKENRLVTAVKRVAVQDAVAVVAVVCPVTAPALGGEYWGLGPNDAVSRCPRTPSSP